MAAKRADAELEVKARELMRHIETLADGIFLQQGKLDVGRREAIVLRLLLEGPVVMGELASRLGIALSTATGIIDRLVERKLVTRTRSASDRRVIVITVSAKGRRAHEEWQANRVEFGAALLTALTPAEREALLAMIRKLGERSR
jgi:DNA-binding MarR family transcriptional regulator